MIAWLKRLFARGKAQGRPSIEKAARREGITAAELDVLLEEMYEKFGELQR